MKRVVVMIALFVGFVGFSQENEAFKADAMELVKLQSEGQFEVMLEPVKQMIPEENQEAFMKELKATMPGLYEQITQIYMDTYTHDEIKEIMKFYATPVGKKMIKVTPEITQKSMQIGQTWGMGLQPLIAKYTK